MAEMVFSDQGTEQGLEPSSAWAGRACRHAANQRFVAHRRGSERRSDTVCVPRQRISSCDQELRAYPSQSGVCTRQGYPSQSCKTPLYGLTADLSKPVWKAATGPVIAPIATLHSASRRQTDPTSITGQASRSADRMPAQSGRLLLNERPGEDDREPWRQCKAAGRQPL